MTSKDVTTERTPHYWRSLADEAQAPEFLEKMQNEFPQGATELEFVSEVDRRKFLGIIGSSLAFAGITSMTGCIRKPKELILPYTKRPEDMIPGKPLFFATSAYIAGSVHGMLVESHEGRPTKIEGNPLHPNSMGSSSLWAQASILDMYDVDRSRFPVNKGQRISLEEFKSFVNSHFGPMRQNGGADVALLIQATPSPAFRHQVSQFKKAFPKAAVYMHDASHAYEKQNALRMAGKENTNVVYSFDRCNVVVSLDSDFLGREGEMIRNSRGFVERRRVSSPDDSMNRLYVAEPMFTNTGVMADHRARVGASRIGHFLLALSNALGAKGVAVNATARRQGEAATGMFAEYAKWIESAADDLVKNRGKSVIIVGENQPAWVQALAHHLNDALGNVGSTVKFVTDPNAVDAGTLASLASRISDGSVSTLVIVGGNPVYDATGDLGFSDLLKKVQTTIHLSGYYDETSQLCAWHVPASHFLEAWGDTRAADGTVALQQPLIAPLFESLSEIEFLNLISSGNAASGHDLLKEFWKGQGVTGSDFEKAWRKWLHDGVVSEVRAEAHGGGVDVRGLSAALESGITAPATDSVEVVFPLDHTIYDGRFANNGWLQEVPDPISKLTWDNAAFMSVATAKRIGVTSGEMVEVNIDGRSLEIAVFEVPGTAESTVVIHQGYGRKFGGGVADGAGFNANQIRSQKAMYFAADASIKKTGKKYKLATTQEHGSMEGRAIVREATLAKFKAEPNFVDKSELIAKDMQKTLLWELPNNKVGHQWGMAVDLNVCTGCSSCTVACNAENNIVVVGKDQVLNGREMHWIRIDRYFTGTVDNPEVVTQPMACVHCETAPCEGVCPVAATVHSPDGLNEMAYNRCVGTRYCANNCPYKVRRFNFFNYNKTADEHNPLLAMARNPNVTVRFRGVMEKCTYCVQRISEAKKLAKVNGTDKIADGAVIPACAQTCPTNAIVFGDVNDPTSRVSQLKKQPRNYAVLGELATQPRTTYLAKLRNPNPEMV